MQQHRCDIPFTNVTQVPRAHASGHNDNQLREQLLFGVRLLLLLGTPFSGGGKFIYRKLLSTSTLICRTVSFYFLFVSNFPYQMECERSEAPVELLQQRKYWFERIRVVEFGRIRNRRDRIWNPSICSHCCWPTRPTQKSQKIITLIQISFETATRRRVDNANWLLLIFISWCSSRISHRNFINDWLPLSETVRIWQARATDSMFCWCSTYGLWSW